MIGCLQIVMNNSHEHRYVPGERVAGHVLVETDTYIECDTTINICLTGHASTQYQAPGGRVPQAEKVTLFRRHQPLYTFPYRADPGRYKWHFDFVFPSHCDRPGESGNVEGDFRQGNVGSPLPPSLDASDKNVTDYKAKVNYSLEASIQYPSWAATGGSGGMTADLSLTYVPPHDGPEPYYRYWVEEHNYLGGTATTSSGHKISPTFRARLTFPTVYVHGQWLLAYLSVVDDDQQKQQPQVYLTDLVVTIVTNTEIWVDGRKYKFQSDTEALRVVRMIRPVKKSSLTHRLTQDPWGTAVKGDGLPPQEGVPIVGPQTSGLKVPSHVCPDFRLPNIVVSHRLRVRATLFFNDRRFTFDKSGALEILAPMVPKEGDSRAAACPASPDITPSYAQETESPPPYSEIIPLIT